MTTFLGNPVTFTGKQLQVGDKALDFSLTTTDLSKKTLADFEGKKKIVSVIPSIDTGICSLQTRRFNQELASLDNTVVLTVSMDLPFAQKRWCGAEGIENVQTLSTFRHKSVHDTLGVNITTGPIAGLTARAVIILDENNNVIHSELVSEIKNEPNYDAALAVL